MFNSTPPTEISTPGTSVTPERLAAAAASARPSVVSWSVSAIASTPVRAASSISCVGDSRPSEKIEWLCKSKLSNPQLYHNDRVPADFHGYPPDPVQRRARG